MGSGASSLQQLMTVFLSYNPSSDFDSAFINRFSSTIDGETARDLPIKVLSSKARDIIANDGDDDLELARDTLRKLMQARIVLLVFSSVSINSMNSLESNTAINRTLLEWNLILELYFSGLIEFCIPIFLGEVYGEPSQSGTFSQSIEAIRLSLDELPAIINSSAVSLTKQVLLEEGVQSSGLLDSRSVQQLAKEITMFQGIAASACKAVDVDMSAGTKGTLSGFTTACVFSAVHHVIETLSRGPPVPSCHVYPSYSWTDFSRKFVVSLRHQLMAENIRGQAVSIFVDTKDLPTGSHIPRTILSYLCFAHVLVPVVTTTAVRRLSALQFNQLSPLLLEWWLMIEVYNRSNHDVRLIPVLIGEISEQPLESGSFAGDSRSLFEAVEQLPDFVCKPAHECIQQAMQHPKFCDILQATRPLETLTVKQIVQRLLKFQGNMNAHECTAVDADPQSNSPGTLHGFTLSLVDKVVGSIMIGLEDVTKSESHDSLVKGNKMGDSAAVATALDDVDCGKYGGSLRELSLGRSSIAVRGLKSLVGLENPQLFARLLSLGIEAIEDEISRSNIKEDAENVKYILHGTACNEPSLPSQVRRDIEKGSYHGGSFKAIDYDFGHAGWTFQDFCNHENSRAAGLSEAEVLALRLYTTSSYPRFIQPLRSRTRPHPWRMTVHYLSEGIRKLRAIEAMTDPEAFVETKFLWRGMKDMVATGADGFQKFGGTELAPISTSASRYVAEMYAASSSPLLLCFETKGTNRGCSLEFLSVYPKEKEFLYPPLTLLTTKGPPAGHAAAAAAPDPSPQTSETVVARGALPTFSVLTVEPWFT